MDERPDDAEDADEKRKNNASANIGTWTGIGIALGVAFGTAMDNVGL